MRAALCVTLCVVLVASAYAEDLSLGDCNDDDAVLVDRNIRRPAIPGIPMYTKLIARAPARSRITCISVNSTDGSDPDLTVIKGGIGHRFVLIFVRGKPGQGLNLQFTARARSRLAPTPTPTPTPKPTPTTGPTTEPPTTSTGIPTGIPTAIPTGTPESSSVSPSPIPTGKPPASSSQVPTTVSPVPSTTEVMEESSSSGTSAPQTTSAPTSMPTDIPTGDAKDSNDDVDDAELSESLNLDNISEDLSQD